MTLTSAKFSMTQKVSITVSTFPFSLINPFIVINKLKNEKYEVDLEIENNKHLFASPINATCDKDFDFDAFKDSGPVNTQNTLFLGSSNDFGGSSILNKNITHITGSGQSKNETLCVPCSIG